MPTEVYIRVKDGDISSTSRTANACHISLKRGEYQVNDVWSSEIDNDAIYSVLEEKGRIYTRQYWVTFGYTGSGKTYTVDALLFRLLNQAKATPTARVSAYQIFGNNVYDILGGNSPLKFYKADNLVVSGQVHLPIRNIDHILSVLKKNRASVPTTMNASSSRSHAIINVSSGTHTYTLVDMAGQESGQSNTNNDVDVRKQGRDINMDMLALKECIRSLWSKGKHIPFRQSLLTLALKDMFFNKSYTAFICTSSLQHPEHFRTDSIAYAASLYQDRETTEDKRFHSFFTKFTEFVEQNGWISCEERILWRQMRNGRLDHCRQIRGFIEKRRRILEQFEATLSDATDDIPSILGDSKASKDKAPAKHRRAKKAGERKMWQNVALVGPSLVSKTPLPPIPNESD